MWRLAITKISPSLILFFGVLSIYLKTLCPTVVGGDSGELISVISTWGIAHPPGYPLYTLLGKLFTWIPHGSIGWRVNFFSAVCDALAAVFVFQIVTKLTGSLAGSLFAAGIFAFSPLVWEYAVVAEVFALNNLLFAAFIYGMICYLESPSLAKAYGLAFLAGLGLSHHHSFILIVLPAGMVGLIRVLPRIREVSSQFRMEKALGYFLLGLSPYLYLPWAGQFHSLDQWGDPLTLGGFLTHVLRREYGTLTLAANILGTGYHPIAFFWNYIHQQLPSMVIAVPVCLGMGILSKWGCEGGKDIPKRRALEEKFIPIYWILGSTWLLYGLVFCLGSHLDPANPLYRLIQSRFWQVLHLILSLFLGVGVGTFWVQRKGISLGAMDRALAALVLGVLAAQVIWFWKECDQSQNYKFQKFAETVLKSLPEHSLLLVSGDFAANSIRYVQAVEGVRPDVPVVPVGRLAATWLPGLFQRHFPDLQFPKEGLYNPDGYRMKDWISLNEARYDVFGCNGLVKEWDHSLEGVYFTWPVGLLERVLPRNKIPSLKEWSFTNHDFYQSYPIHELKGVRTDLWEYQIYNLYWAMRRYFVQRLGEYLGNAGVEKLDGYSEAREILEEEKKALN